MRTTGHALGHQAMASAALAIALLLALACMTGCASGSSTVDDGAAKSAGDAQGAAVTAQSSYPVVDAAFVREHLDDAAIVDVRTASEFDEGHIPGAVNITYGTTPCTAGELDADLAAAYEAAGLGPDEPVVLYCRTGVRAQAAACVLERLGYRDISVYEGSWVDWTADPENPIEAEA